MTDSQKLDLLLEKMGDIDAKVDRLADRMDRMETRMDQLESHMDQLENRMDQLESHMSQIETHMDQLKTRMDQTEQKIINIDVHLENKTDKNIQLIAENFIELTNKLNQAIPAADNNLMYEVKVNYLVGEVNKRKEEVEKIKDRIA